MKVLLSDGSGLTSRQVSTILGRKGHEVHVLCPEGLTLTKLTGWVRKVHSVPPFGPDPYLWLTSAVAVMLDEKPQLFICTQEQVAIIAAELHRLKDLGIDIHLAVPEFSSLKAVIDKVLARQTLKDLGLPQPESIVASSEEEVAQSSLFPAFVKTPIGTASTGVKHAETSADLVRVGKEYHKAGSFKNGGQLLVQKAALGPLLMISSVFSHGTLIAWHACLRVREGSGGGASVKSSLPLPIIQEHLIKLGQYLKWHGALSLDAILDEGSPKYIDINPRLVEPMNALYAGVDLVEALIEVSFEGDRPVTVQKVRIGRLGVESHQIVLAMVGAGQRGRRALIDELWMVLFHLGDFRNSVEELTPPKGDIWGYFVVIGLFVILFVHGAPGAKKMSTSAVSKYALSAEGWAEILKNQREKGSRPERTSSEAGPSTRPL
jgi:hypothetical protein